MYSPQDFHDAAEQHLREDREREADVASDARHNSELQDRGFVRRALDRGMSEEEIENSLLRASEFERLNPGRDPLAYVRGLIDEESSSAHGLGEREASTPSTASSKATTVGNGDDTRAATSEAVARQYIQENFEPSDWLAVVIRNRESGDITQRVATAEKISSREFQAWLRHKNANSSDIYLSLNTFKEQARSRTKDDVKEIRHVYLDLDHDGSTKLAAIQNDGSLPQPNYVLNTSAGKFQVIWKVTNMQKEEAEGLLRTLAQRYGGDPATTDSTRVFRLPGFSNKKHEDDFTVTVRREAPIDRIYRRADFRLDSTAPEKISASTRSSALPQSQGESNRSQSERDWSFALRHLKEGAKPEDIVRQIAAYRAVDHKTHNPERPEAPRKTNPRHYAERTVQRAIAHLGMSPASQEAQVPTGSSSPEVEPSR